MKNNKHRRKAEKKKKKKNLNLKTQYWFLEFPYKRNIHNSCDLPKFCYNYLANPQILKDARLTFFNADQSQQFLSLFHLFLEAESKLVQFCTKFKVKWVLFLRQNVPTCRCWHCAANHQYRKITTFIKNFKEQYGYFSINSLPQNQTIYQLKAFLGINL